MAACTPALREALNDSICSGRFVDTKIILFSRRDSSGTITKPRALYASSRVLRTVPHFNDCKLFFGFTSYQMLTTFECSLVNSAKQSRRTSPNLSTIANLPVTMGITLTVISRRTRILPAQRKRRVKRDPLGVTFLTPFLCLLLNMSPHPPMANTKNASRKEKSSRYVTWPSSRKTPRRQDAQLPV